MLNFDPESFFADDIEMEADEPVSKRSRDSHKMFSAVGVNQLSQNVSLGFALASKESVKTFNRSQYKCSHCGQVKKGHACQGRRAEHTSGSVPAVTTTESDFSPADRHHLALKLQERLGRRSTICSHTLHYPGPQATPGLAESVSGGRAAAAVASSIDWKAQSVPVVAVTAAPATSAAVGVADGQACNHRSGGILPSASLSAALPLGPLSAVTTSATTAAPATPALMSFVVATLPSPIAVMAAAPPPLALENSSLVESVAPSPEWLAVGSTPPTTPAQAVAARAGDWSHTVGETQTPSPAAASEPAENHSAAGSSSAAPAVSVAGDGRGSPCKSKLGELDLSFLDGEDGRAVFHGILSATGSGASGGYVREGADRKCLDCSSCSGNCDSSGDRCGGSGGETGEVGSGNGGSAPHPKDLVVSSESDPATTLHIPGACCKSSFGGGCGGGGDCGGGGLQIVGHVNDKAVESVVEAAAGGCSISGSGQNGVRDSDG